MFSGEGFPLRRSAGRIGKPKPFSAYQVFFCFEEVVLHHSPQNPDIAHVEALARTKVADCYQCGKCSAGCPQADKMDILPSTIIRLIQYGDVEKAASTEAVWQCVGCLTCSTRCPKSVNIAGVMDSLKQISIEKKCIHPKQKRILAFQRSFLNAVKRNGRTNELEMVAEYKIRGFLGDANPVLAMKDAGLGLPMLMRDKLHIKIGSPVKDKNIVKRIFVKCSEN
jgi:heterodisulfide reductase subunit C